MKKLMFIMTIVIVLIGIASICNATCIYFKGAIDTPLTQEVGVVVSEHVEDINFNQFQTYKKAIVELNRSVLHALISLKPKIGKAHISSSKYSLETKTLRCSFKVKDNNVERKITVFVEGVSYAN